MKHPLPPWLSCSAVRLRNTLNVAPTPGVMTGGKNSVCGWHRWKPTWLRAPQLAWPCLDQRQWGPEVTLSQNGSRQQATLESFPAQYSPPVEKCIPHPSEQIVYPINSLLVWVEFILLLLHPDLRTASYEASNKTEVTRKKGPG